MYFPILRGKQSELLALRECKSQLSSTNVVTPIIEPVKTGTRDLLRCIGELSGAEANHIIICNPQVGDFVREQRSLSRLIDEIKESSELTKFAYIIHEETSANELRLFSEITEGRNISLVHQSAHEAPQELTSIINSDFFDYHIFMEHRTSRRYREQYPSEISVYIQDHFRQVERNADYANPSNELFSDRYSTYQGDGLLGFGDFSIIGDNYKSSGGGQAHVAAIHLVYKKSSLGEVWVRHFLSEIYNYPNPQAELINEALPEIVEFIRDRELLEFSTACQELVDFHETAGRTNLARMKRIGIKHHLELMMHLLAHSG